MEFLVDIDTLKEYSYIQSNVNTETLTITLKRVQDRYIEPAVGSSLYKRLLQGVKEDDLTADELELMERVLNVIYVGCDIKSATHQNWKIRNKSVGTGNDEHVNANSLNESNNLIDELKKDLAIYKNKLIGYLKDNKSKFPLYKCSSNSEDINPESKGNSYSDRISFL